MSAADERYELMSEPEHDANPPTWWIQDVTTVAGDAPGDPLAMIEVLRPNAWFPEMVTEWTTDVLTTEAVIVLTVDRQDAPGVVARLLAALNGGTNE